MVFQQLGEFTEDRAFLRAFDVRLHRHRAIGAHHLHQLGGEEDGVEIVLLLVGRTLEHLGDAARSEEHTSELQSLMRISYAVFCLKKKKKTKIQYKDHNITN